MLWARVNAVMIARSCRTVPPSRSNATRNSASSPPLNAHIPPEAFCWSMIVAVGTPDTVAKVAGSYTGKYLRAVL